MHFDHPPPIPLTCTVRICARYLYQALENCALNTEIQYGDDLNPIVLRNLHSASFLEVIMPMRL